MTQGIELLEIIYGQLHEAGVIRSKGEFSERLLGKSPSYLTSMRAKQRVISSDIIMGLCDALLVEIDILGSDPADGNIRAVLRRTVAQVNNYLADQTIPRGNCAAKAAGGRKHLTANQWRGELASGAGGRLTCLITNVRRYCPIAALA